MTANNTNVLSRIARISYTVCEKGIEVASFWGELIFIREIRCHLCDSFV